jgi:transposase
LAQRYSVSTETIRKWRKRGSADCQDRSSRPHKLPWKASQEERAIVCALRRATGFPLDDLTFVVTHFLPHLNRDAVYRILKAEGLGRLPPASRPRKPNGTFKDYDLGFVHVDVKHLPKLRTQDGQSRKRYLYVAIDRASRFVHLAVKDDETERSAVAFRKEAVRAFPFQVTHVPTAAPASQLMGSRPLARAWAWSIAKRGPTRRAPTAWSSASTDVCSARCWASPSPATAISKRSCRASIRPTMRVANACSRAAHPRGSCASASAQPQPAPTAITIRRSIPAACPKPFR